MTVRFNMASQEEMMEMLLRRLAEQNAATIKEMLAGKKIFWRNLLFARLACCAFFFMFAR